MVIDCFIKYGLFTDMATLGEYCINYPIYWYEPSEIDGGTQFIQILNNMITDHTTIFSSFSIWISAVSGEFMIFKSTKAEWK